MSCPVQALSPANVGLGGARSGDYFRRKVSCIRLAQVTGNAGYSSGLFEPGCYSRARRFKLKGALGIAV